jgi:hypothetical protein
MSTEQTREERSCDEKDVWVDVDLLLCGYVVCDG